MYPALDDIGLDAHAVGAHAVEQHLDVRVEVLDGAVLDPDLERPVLLRRGEVEERAADGGAEVGVLPACAGREVPQERGVGAVVEVRNEEVGRRAGVWGMAEITARLDGGVVSVKKVQSAQIRNTYRDQE